MTSEASVSSPAAISRPSAQRDFHFLRSFVAGGVAGCCAKTTIAPLDRVKILLQAQNPHYKHLGVFSTLKAVPKKEGFFGLYKGNGAMMVRIFPYGAIQFMALDTYKKLLSNKLGISGHIHWLMAGSMAEVFTDVVSCACSWLRGRSRSVLFGFWFQRDKTHSAVHLFESMLGCGGQIGMTAVIFTYPLDVIRARLAFQVKGEHRYTGIINAFQTIYLKEGGIMGFYRGLIPTLIGMAPYSGFSFFTFGTLKSMGLKHFPDRLGTPSLDNPNVIVLKAHVNMVCGGMAGAIAQTISYPLDVARRRMQLGAVLPDSDKCVSLTKTLKYVYTTYGIKKGLYRGLSLNYIRCVPSQAVAFTVYEFMKQVLYLN